MNIPPPVPGLVLKYSYLWLSEHRSGREDGHKDRPCAIVLVASLSGDRPEVTVLPITHSQPREPGSAIEIPQLVKQRLGMDDERSWVVLTEANRFLWPGPDLRSSTAGDAASIAYGPLPYAFFERIRIAFLNALKERRASTIERTE